MADWFVGQKVVCINDQGMRRPDVVISGRLCKGGVYVVRSVFLWDVVCVRLEEIACLDWRPGFEWGFIVDRFRPLVNQSTEISVFETILNNLPQSADELEAVDHV